MGWRARGVKGSFNRRTGEGCVLREPDVGDYARAQASGEPRAVRAAGYPAALLLRAGGRRRSAGSRAVAAALVDALRAAVEWRNDKLTSSEYDETTWSAHGSARTWVVSSGRSGTTRRSGRSAKALYKSKRGDSYVLARGLGTRRGAGRGVRRHYKSSNEGM